MQGHERDSVLERRVVDALYLEAMLLADEARSYFEEQGRGERDGLAAGERVLFSCESLRVTTRLMHVIAWLMTRRAVEAGELSFAAALDPSRRLGEATPPIPADVAMLPQRARALVAASAALHRRVAALDQALAAPQAPISPARTMQERLAAVF